MKEREDRNIVPCFPQIFYITFIFSESERETAASLWEFRLFPSYPNTFQPAISDDDPDRPAEDRSPAAPGEGGAEDRPVLRVRRRGPHPPHGHVRAHSALAGLHMVRIRIFFCQILVLFPLFFSRYAIGYAERTGPRGNIGWLSSLANATNQPYLPGGKGGPSIKVKTGKPILPPHHLLAKVKNISNIAENILNHVFPRRLFFIGNCVSPFPPPTGNKVRYREGQN